jgi:hypothetical protein
MLRLFIESIKFDRISAKHQARDFRGSRVGDFAILHHGDNCEERRETDEACGKACEASR